MRTNVEALEAVDAVVGHRCLAGFHLQSEQGDRETVTSEAHLQQKQALRGEAARRLSGGRVS